MPFITKLDFSSNRQIKQHIETVTSLSGETIFGVPFSYLPSGPNLATTGITSELTNPPSNIVSTFSGNSGTTIYTWYNSNMQLAASVLSALTPTNSGTTQITGQIYTATSSTIIDGNNVNLTWSGVSFDVSVIQMVVLTGNTYSGTVSSSILDFLSAATLDFTGRTIWVDVSGITRTQNLIISSGAIPGYVWTCSTPEGWGYWDAISNVISGTTIWTAGTGIASAVLAYTTDKASGNYSLAEGFNTTTSIDYGHVEGYQSLCGGPNPFYPPSAHAEGYQTTSNGGLGSHSEGQSTVAVGSSSHAEGNLTNSVGVNSHSEGLGSSAGGPNSHAEGAYTTSNGAASHSEGSGTTAIGNYSHAGGYNSIANGTTSFVFGSGSTVNGNGSVVLGVGITGNSNNTVYVPNLNIGLFTVATPINGIGVDINGNVGFTSSDIRLKENINTIENALDKVKNLRGVTYNWKNRYSGGNNIRLGFIAQEVNDVIPELTFVNNKSEEKYMGVHYDTITALLVEAIKELSNENFNNVRLETQTIFAEDNDIQLNFSGNSKTAIGGGIKVLHAMGQNQSAEIITDSDGNWVTNNNMKPKALIIPLFTPSSSNDISGVEGSITRDDNYLYLKTKNGWRRSNLESF